MRRAPRDTSDIACALYHYDVHLNDKDSVKFLVSSCSYCTVYRLECVGQMCCDFIAVCHDSVNFTLADSIFIITSYHGWICSNIHGPLWH